MATATKTRGVQFSAWACPSLCGGASGLDQYIKDYADSIYEKHLMESVATLNSDKSAYLRLRALRNTGGLPWSGVDTQNILAVHTQHIERCIAARLESYRAAFLEAKQPPGEDDLSAILQEFKSVQQQQVRNSSAAIKMFLNARSAIIPIDPTQSLTNTTAHGHDRTLREWKIWRDRVRIQRASALPGGASASPMQGVGAETASPVEQDDLKFCRLAIEEARKTVAADDGRVHPRVGAVVVKNGQVLSKAHRGELPENHAEYIALEKKLADEAVAGATVYTTLEPCTTRNHPKIPCAKRLIERKVARVVIGMLDPNPDILGRGQRLLREANIETQFFPHELMAEVEDLNRDFIRAHELGQETSHNRFRTIKYIGICLLVVSILVVGVLMIARKLRGSDNPVHPRAETVRQSPPATSPMTNGTQPIETKESSHKSKDLGGTAHQQDVIPREIIEQWKKDLPRLWRKHPLGQASIGGFEQVFDAGVCDGGVNDLTKEIPGQTQAWGLRDARFGCVSNQMAAPGTLDFDPKTFSYASIVTLVPLQFDGDSMSVSLSWFSPIAKGKVKWEIATACIGEGQSLDTELTNKANIVDGPQFGDPAKHVLSVGQVPLRNCKGSDMLIIRLGRYGRDDDDSLPAVARVEKVAIDLGNGRKAK